MVSIWRRHPSTTYIRSGKALQLTTTAELNIFGDLVRWFDSRHIVHPWSDPKQAEPARIEQDNIIILRYKSDAAPNISLNSHKQYWRGELRAAAAFGILLQSAVAFFFFFTPLYPMPMLLKDGNTIPFYANICTFAGTVTLVLGMMFCAHVVESSTKEERYQACHGERTRVIWLQQTKTVSDQLFDSCALFAQDNRDVFTISTRASETDMAAMQGPKICFPDLYRISPAHKTIGATLFTLVGYVIQFVGLRGMPWLASISQLVAILIMACVRAYVRRGLAEPLGSRQLTPQFELDWFALSLSKPCTAPWAKRQDDGVGEQEYVVDDWRVLSGRDSSDQAKLCEPSQGDVIRLTKKQRCSPNDGVEYSLTAHGVMLTRKRLGWLAAWRGPASTAAVALARAIEITAEAFHHHLPLHLQERMVWPLKVEHAKISGQQVDIRLLRQGGKWRAFANEIEAVLSLWLYSVSRREQAHQGTESEPSDNRSNPNADEDAWLRSKGPSSLMQSLRLLGPDSLALRRDLAWWVPHDAGTILHVREDRESGMTMCHHRVVGRGTRIMNEAISNMSQRRDQDQHGEQFRQHLIRYTTTEQVSFDPSADDETDVRQDTSLAVLSSDLLPLLYAQDLFSSFVWAVASSIDEPIKGGTDIMPDTSMNENGWQSLTLRNKLISKLAQDVHSTGLGDLGQIYLSIIPPLSANQRLPETDSICELARQKAKPQEQSGEWHEAGRIYSWLFKVAITFPEHSRTHVRGTAILLEFLRELSFSLELRQNHSNMDGISELKNLQERLRVELDQHSPILPDLMLLSAQRGQTWYCGRGWKDAPTPRILRLPPVFGHTPLQMMASQGNLPANMKYNRSNEDVNQKDIYDWTPLHHFASKGRPFFVDRLMLFRPKLDARDLLEWTPLHYASAHSNAEAYQVLVDHGANVNLQGRGGATPLHMASANGCLEMVTSLVEIGAVVDAVDCFGDTPLHWAVYQKRANIAGYLQTLSINKPRNWNNMTALQLAVTMNRTVDESHDTLDLIRQLVDAGGDMEIRDRGGGTCLHLATELGHQDRVSLLIDMGANIEAEERAGKKPLHLAAIRGDVATMKVLMNKGADIEAMDRDNKTPLYVAAEEGSEVAAEFLIEAGAKKNARNLGGSTVLHISCKGKDEGVVRLLLSKGADKDAIDNEGMTPLHQASERLSFAIVKLLIEHGAVVGVKDVQGMTPLHLAAANNHDSPEVVSCMQLLLQSGADKEARDKRGRTPLHAAASRGRQEVVQYLVDVAGADMGAEDDRGMTPFLVAASQGKDDVVQMFLDRGESIEARNKLGHTPLILAAKKGHERTVQMLLDRGADAEARGQDGLTAMDAARRRKRYMEMGTSTVGEFM